MVNILNLDIFGSLSKILIYLLHLHIFPLTYHICGALRLHLKTTHSNFCASHLITHIYSLDLLQLRPHSITNIGQLEKKKLEYEYLREQRRRFEAEMELLDLQSKREEDDIHRLSHEINRFSVSGHQSEPTTPPEYRDNGFPSAFSRPNRFSISSIASPPGMGTTRASRSGSQITSPPSASSTQGTATTHVPSKSVPGSRRNSDEEAEDDSYDYDLASMNPVQRG